MFPFKSSMRSLWFSGGDSYLRMRMLHRLNPELQLKNDIFDLETR